LVVPYLAFALLRRHDAAVGRRAGGPPRQAAAIDGAPPAPAP
jgi:hypothetical protein